MVMNVLVIAHAGVSVWWAFVGYAYMLLLPIKMFLKIISMPKEPN